MNLPIVRILALVTCLALTASAAEPPAATSLPFVYTQWQHFTEKDGLPDDHIFAVKVAGDKVWIGTENGLACYDKKTGKIRSWNTLSLTVFPPITSKSHTSRMA